MGLVTLPRRPPCTGTRHGAVAELNLRLQFLRRASIGVIFFAGRPLRVAADPRLAPSQGGGAGGQARPSGAMDDRFGIWRGCRPERARFWHGVSRAQGLTLQACCGANSPFVRPLPLTEPRPSEIERGLALYLGLVARHAAHTANRVLIPGPEQCRVRRCPGRLFAIGRLAGVRSFSWSAF